MYSKPTYAKEGNQQPSTTPPCGCPPVPNFTQLPLSNPFCWCKVLSIKWNIIELNSANFVRSHWHLSRCQNVNYLLWYLSLHNEFAQCSHCHNPCLVPYTVVTYTVLHSSYFGQGCDEDDGHLTSQTPYLSNTKLC